MTATPLYRRVVLKASGEALMGDQHFGIDVSVVDRIAADIAEARALGVEVGVVIGGGNIFRGVAVASKGGDRVTGDHMGMLATVINSLALRTSLVKIGVDAVVLSAIAMPEICESFSQRQATSRAGPAIRSSRLIRQRPFGLPKSERTLSSRARKWTASIPQTPRRTRMPSVTTG